MSPQRSGRSSDPERTVLSVTWTSPEAQPLVRRVTLKRLEPGCMDGYWTLRSRRLAMGWSQRVLAQAAALRAATINRVENAHQGCQHNTKRKWLKALRLPFEAHKALFWQPHSCPEWDGLDITWGSMEAGVCAQFGTCFRWVPPGLEGVADE